MIMDFDKIIKSRYSCRSYDPIRPVALKDIEAIIETARLSPSACNSQTWRFIIITERSILDKIHDDAMRLGVGNHFLKHAPCLIVGCSKLDILANTIGTTVSGIDYYQVDMGIAMEHMALMATNLGLASCWIGWFHDKSIRKILGIPRKIKITALMAIGYPKHDIVPVKSRKPIDEIMMMQKWQD